LAGLLLLASACATIRAVLNVKTRRVCDSLLAWEKFLQNANGRRIPGYAGKNSFNSKGAVTRRHGREAKQIAGAVMASGNEDWRLESVQACAPQSEYGVQECR